MMRYYFHLESADDTILDDEGVELDGDPELALIETLQALEDMSRENPELMADYGAGWRFKVVDVSGAILFSLSLDEGTADDFVGRHAVTQSKHNLS